MNFDPIFLTLGEILEIHAYQVENFGGADGIRDINILKSAIGMPSATFAGEYLHSTVFEMAAAYLFHLVENHPFLDGNKRMGAMSAVVFLDMNGYDFDVPDAEFANVVLSVASGQMTKAEVALFFQAHSTLR